jgi:threonine efflux protein
VLVLLPLLGVWLLALVSPGPDFLVTVQYATSRSRRHGIAVGLGVSSAMPALPRPAGSLWRAWRAGFLTNLGNPQAAAFFGSLLGALRPAHAGVGLRLAVVPLMAALGAGWYTVVATLFGLAPVARVYRRVRRWVDRVMAALLIALGGRLALDR